MNKDITKSQIAAIQTAIHTKGLQEEKINLVQQYSNGRTSSVAKLSFTEAHEMLKMLNTSPRPSPVREGGKPGDKMIRSIIAMAREMGVITREAVVLQSGAIEEKSNYTQFNEWLLNKSCVKKKNLNSCSYEELNNLVSQYRAIYKYWLQKHH